MSDDVYEIYAVRYAHHDRPAADNYIGFAPPKPPAKAGGDSHDLNQPLDYFVWAIVGRDRMFIVDTGFTPEMAAARGRTITKPVADGLIAIGIQPDSVTDVVISHMHYDHCGNHDLFPRARYHLQDVEMAYSTGRCMCHAQIRIPFEADDVIAMVRKVFAGRVAFHDGDEPLAPGITLHRIGGHSKGLQSVRVKTRRGNVVLASDATHLYAHIDEGRVFPVTYNVAETVEGYEKLKRLADSRAHIVPGHDPKVLQEYPAARPGLEGWVVRLDVDPRLV